MDEYNGKNKDKITEEEEDEGRGEKAKFVEDDLEEEDKKDVEKEGEKVKQGEEVEKKRR